MSDPDHVLWPRARHLPIQAFNNVECSSLWGQLQGGRQMPEDLFAIAKASRVEAGRILELGHLAGIGLCFPEVLAEVEARYRAKEIRRIGAAMVNSEQTDAAEWARQLVQLAAGARSLAVAESFNAYDVVPDGDPTILLGDSYLCRGDGLVLTSTSGMGKSSMALQMATCFALGRDFQGLKCNGPLRSLVIQAEDSRGDIGKVRRSIFHAMALSEADRAKVGANLLIVSKKGLRGQSFLEELRRLVAKHKPDLVWVNPLQAFIDGDITDNQQLSQFLRGELDGLNDENAFAWMIVHHTVKPPKGKDKGDLAWHEVMYDMSGGAEIINWARAIMSLRATGERGEFNLVLAKRGSEADVTREIEQGAGVRDEIITTLPLKWSDEYLEVPGRKKKMKVIYWLPRVATAEEKNRKGPGGRNKVHEFATYRAAFPTTQSSAQKPAVIQRACEQYGHLSKSAFFRILDDAVADGFVVRVAENPQWPRYYAKA